MKAQTISDNSHLLVDLLVLIYERDILGIEVSDWHDISVLNLGISSLSIFLGLLRPSLRVPEVTVSRFLVLSA